ncbi:hypothetical protein MJH12_07410, partial [bacterium]|nr:hypothetical protein [bacterium]
MFKLTVVLVLCGLIYFAYKILQAKQSGTLQTFTKYIDAKKLFEENNYLACEELLIEIIQEFPNHIKALSLLLDLYKLIDRKKALPEIYIRLLELPSAIKKELNEKQLRLELAEVCYELASFDDAFEHYLHLLADETDEVDVGVLNRLAYLYSSQSKFVEAQSLYEKILEEDPQNILAMRGLILCLLG